MTWLVAFTSGAFAALGIAQAASGRLFRVFNRRGVDWRIGEARLIGLSWAVVGVTWAAYALYVGLSFILDIPQFWVGHWWGTFISPVPLVLIGALVLQALIEQRHNHRWPFKGGGLRRSG